MLKIRSPNEALCGLINSERVNVEVKWLNYMLKNNIIDKKKLKLDSFDVESRLKRFENFSIDDFNKIKTFEKQTNHDIKAVEYFIKSELNNLGFNFDFAEYTHFLCTSEDINNLSYGLMVSRFRDGLFFESQKELLKVLSDLALNSKNDSLLSRTHGQPATPTTMGKEIANFVFRNHRLLMKAKAIKFQGKMNGAVGNFNAHYIVDPNKDWKEIARGFVEDELGLEFNPFSTQIEPHDSMCEFFQLMSLMNTIYIGMSQDIWGYISKGYFSLKINKLEIGSSIMPHKVNPIDFENAEGNLGTANALLEFFVRKLPISRFQRDLSDSTVLRNIGVAAGHSILAYKSLINGISKLQPQAEFMKKELDEHLEVLAEPIQQILRNE